MYNNIEQPVNKTNQKKSKKILEISLLLIVVLWGVLFLINYLRYSDGKAPLFSLIKTIDYEDGSVTEYISLGYVYRTYNRRSIQKVEFVPFWHRLEQTSDATGLPYTHQDYNVPENEMEADKYKGLLYYYDEEGNLLGTYKCINSERNCNKAYAGHDKYDTINKDYLTTRSPRKIEHLYDKYAFIDDSVKQQTEYGNENYKRTIYLFDIANNKLLYRFGDIKDSTYNEYKKSSSGDDYRYIIKDYDTDKWGIVKITETGVAEEVLPFEYDSINYDEDTKHYIMCKENKWFIYDLNNNKIISPESEEVIYDVWINYNNTYYYKTGIENSKLKNDINYKIYRIDGTEFLNIPNVSEIISTKHTIIYLNKNDATLRVIDYVREEKGKIQLFFTDMSKDELNHPAFEIDQMKEDYIYLKIYKGRELKNSYETASIYIKNNNY